MGGGERELGMGCNGGCEVNKFGNRVEKGGCIVDRVRDRNMERKNECVLETDGFLRWLGEED